MECRVVPIRTGDEILLEEIDSGSHAHNSDANPPNDDDLNFLGPNSVAQSRITPEDKALAAKLSSRKINVSFSARCKGMCVGAAETACCNFYKHLLLLASAVVMALMIPLLGTVYQVRGGVILGDKCQNITCTFFFAFHLALLNAILIPLLLII